MGQRLRRPAILLLKVFLFAAVVVGALGAGRLVERHVRTAPAFALSEVTLEGNSRLDRDTVLSSADLLIGANVFDVAPEDAEARLEAHPWIASARVRRRLPGAFDVEIREHRPVALLTLQATEDQPAVAYLISEEGAVFKRVSSEDPVNLPVITGADVERFAADRAYRTQLLLEVVALLHDYRGAGLWRREPIGEIHADSRSGLSLFIGEGPTYVRLGRGPFREKLRRLRRVLDHLQTRETPASYIYLDNVRRADRVTVRLREGLPTEEEVVAEENPAPPGAT